MNREVHVPIKLIFGDSKGKLSMEGDFARESTLFGVVKVFWPEIKDGEANYVRYGNAFS